MSLDTTDIYVPSDIFQRNLAKSLAVSDPPIGITERERKKSKEFEALESVDEFLNRGGKIEVLPRFASSTDEVYDQKFNRTETL